MKKLYFFLAILLRLLLLIPIIGSPLWYDENFTLLMIRHPLDQMLLAASGDVHPPLYYLLLWPLGQIHGAPAWIIRIPSLLFSIAALFVWWAILEKLIHNTKVQRAAWVLFAISSVGLYYAGEGRMYALLTLLLLAAMWAMLERRWLLLGVFAALLLWTHNYGIIYLACLWLAGWLFDRHTRKQLSLTLGLAGLTFLPWLAVLNSQMDAIQGGYWLFRLTLPSALYALYQSFSLYGKLLNDIYGQVVFFGWLAFTIGWLLITWRRFKHNVFFCMPTYLVLAFGPFLLAIIGSLLWQPILLYRALTPCAPFIGLLLCLPLAFEFENQPRPMLLAAVFIIPFLVVNSAKLYIPGYHLRGVDDALILDALHTLEDRWQPGDAVLHIGDGSLVDMLPYAAHPESHYKSASCGEEALGSLSPLTRQALGMQIIDPALLTGHYWLVTSESPMTPACEIPLTQSLTDGLQPVTCIVDNDLARSCLYELAQ
jgi:uncharacterized membrane protein